MIRQLALLTLLAIASPLEAHSGLALDGPLHRLLHAVGTDTVIALGGALLVGLAAIAARRVLRARAHTASGESRH